MAAAINTVVVQGNLAREIRVVDVHGPKLPDHELVILDARAHLLEEKRARRVDALEDPDAEPDQRQDEQDDGMDMTISSVRLAMRLSGFSSGSCRREMK